MSFYLNKNRGLEKIINEFLENKKRVLENKRKGLFILFYLIERKEYFFMINKINYKR